MRVLVGCEKSGAVRRAFRALGYEAYSCDLEAADDGETEYHYQCDILEVLDYGWDLLIGHPECRWLAVSGIHWNYRGRNGLTPEECWKETDKAVEFFMTLAEADIPYIALENPVSIISTRWRPYDQAIQPYEFGHNASKKTCLWLKNLPKLIVYSQDRYPGRIVEHNGKLVERWDNQTDSGQNRLGPSENRSALRADTYPGIANAFAEQWGKYVSERVNDYTLLKAA